MNSIPEDGFQPCYQATLSYADIRNAGPPCTDVEFPPAMINLAVVGKVTYYDEETEEFMEDNAFFRAPLSAEEVVGRSDGVDGTDRSGGRNNDANMDSVGNVVENRTASTECAYMFLTDSMKRKTQMGSVQLCRVLERHVLHANDSARDLIGDVDESMSDEDDFSNSSLSSTNSLHTPANSQYGREVIYYATNRIVAVKISSKHTVMQRWASGQGRAENPWREIAAAQLIGNEYPNLLGIIDALQDDDNLYTVMPYCPGGDLCDYIEKHKDRTEEHARYCFIHILQGLNQLQLRGIFHRDISIENILLQNDGIVIIDYGMCVRIPIGEDGKRRLMMAQGACGKVRYMAPETFANRVGNRHSVDGPSCDLWAAGVILFILLTGKFPYLQPDPNDIGFCFATKNLTALLKTWEIEISDSATDLLQNMFQIYPHLRYSLEQVMEHPWVNGRAI